MAANKLSNDEIQQHLPSLPGWSENDGVLRRTFEFANFIKAMEFVNQLAEMAESVQHHPDLDIRYNKVTVGLTTHDAGGLTSSDIQMAATASDLAEAVS